MLPTLRYIANLLLFQLALITLAYVSFQLTSVTHSLLLYLPLVVGIVSIHWFGWRVLPTLLINGVTTMLIWGVSHLTPKLLLISTHEAAVALASWLLYSKLFKDPGPQLGTSRSFLGFVSLAVVIPISLNSVYVYNYGFIKGDLDKVALYWLSDFLTILPIATALLYIFKFDSTTRKFSQIPLYFKKNVVIELAGVSILFIALSLIFPFDRFWFIYGIGATIVSLRWGFAASITINLIIFLLNYLFPLFDFASPLLINHGSTQYISVHLGMATMMFVSLLVGRVVSDLRIAQKNLKSQKARVDHINSELQKANQELDRFVYSASHDLSAPLKSIKGLVTICRLDGANIPEYLQKIDQSVLRLEEFISEVLDYSRTSRKNPTPALTPLEEVFKDIHSRFEYLQEVSKINFKLDLSVRALIIDRFLLQVALSNLLSNAIKYQKNHSEHQSHVYFRSYQTDQEVILEIEDNGEGIRPQYQNKLFDMFYRGTATSSGSGLGLYIAQEAIKKAGGRIEVESEWGEGSVFRIHLPLATLPGNYTF
ncbi:MAG: GHKL domain-containing protein [Cyclobacteriaceae bacterium]|nr:GHKL domain-containing protein [Cyclobacteriaceae bacterium]